MCRRNKETRARKSDVARLRQSLSEAVDIKALRIISGELQEERRAAAGNTRPLIGIETLPGCQRRIKLV